MNKAKNNNSNNGQSLILVALLLVVLLGLLALVIDGGYTYFQRREAQTAADAGALAGARELCETGSVDLAIERAWEYAIQRNNADQATTTVDASTVTVEARIIFDTFFGSVLGRPQITVSAVAEAGCILPDVAMGIMPIAFSCNVADPLPLPEETPEPSKFDRDCDFRLDKLYIIMDSKKLDQDFFCQDPPNEGEPPGAIDCDYTGPDGVEDGIDDLIAGGGRSWLDLNGGGGGSIELVEWINGGLQEDIYTHTWFGGQSGVDNNVFQAVENRVNTGPILVPVFDMYCDQAGLPENNCPDLYHDGIPDDEAEDSTVVSGGTSTLYYHVITFAAFNIECVSAPPSTGCPGHDAAVAAGAIANNVKTIEGYFTREFYSTIKGTPGGGVDAGVYGVYLIR